MGRAGRSGQAGKGHAGLDPLSMGTELESHHSSQSPACRMEEFHRVLCLHCRATREEESQDGGPLTLGEQKRGQMLSPPNITSVIQPLGNGNVPTFQAWKQIQRVQGPWPPSQPGSPQIRTCLPF